MFGLWEKNVVVDEGRPSFPVVCASKSKFVVAVLSLVSGSAISFLTGHQCVALRSPLSKASRMAARPTLMYLSSGSFIEMDRD